MKRDLTSLNNPKKKTRIIDPLDFDMSTGLHYDPIRNPPTPHEYKDEEEYDLIHDAYWIGVVPKDNPKDYTRYLQMWNEYKNTTTYKRQIAAYDRYKERLALLRKKHGADPTEYLEALKAWNEERLSYV